MQHGSKKRTWILRGSIAACAAIALLAVCRVTVVYDPQPQAVNGAGGEQAAAGQLTVAEQYCADNWDSKMLPTIAERAVALPAFVAGLRGDLAALGAEHAARANETSPWSFCLTGRAKVLAVENPEQITKKRLLLDVEPYDGQADVKVQISSVIKTNAVRDAVGFLKLDDFANQVEFAELTKAFNAKLQASLIKSLDAEALVGKEIELTGCVSVTGAEKEEVLIVPVQLNAVGG